MGFNLKKYEYSSEFVQFFKSLEIYKLDDYYKEKLVSSLYDVHYLEVSSLYDVHYLEVYNIKQSIQNVHINCI